MLDDLSTSKSPFRDMLDWIKLEPIPCRDDVEL
jgi:hypothetical protein